MEIPLDEVVYVDVVLSSPTTGAATDADSTPTFEVFEENTDTDIGVGGNFTKRTSKTGNYRATFTCSAANGFELGKWYSVIASATVGGVAGKEVVKNFRCVAAELVAGYRLNDLAKWLGGTIPAVSVTGVPLVDAKYLLGTVFATPATAGILDANAKNINNVATTSVTAVNANVGTTQPVNFTGTGASALAKSDMVDIAGQAAAAAAGVTFPSSIASPTNITAGTITTATNVTNGVTVTTNNDKTGYALSTAGILAIWHQATAAVVTAGTVGKYLLDSIAALLVGVTVTTNNDKTGYTASTVTDKTGYSLSTAGILAIWHQAVSAVVTAGTVGKYLLDSIAALLTGVTVTTNNDKTGYTASTVSDKTGYTVSTNNDKTGYSLSSGGVQAIWDALTSALTTSGSIGKWILDKLDVVLSTRLASGSYTAPDNTTITTIDTKIGAPASSVSADIAALPTSVTASVWASGARTLTSFGSLVADIVTAVWSGVTRTLTAIGFPVDTNENSSEAAIRAKTDNLPDSPAAVGSAMTLTSDYDPAKTAAPTAAQNAAGVLDLANGVETSYTLRQAMRLLLAANAGKISGAGTTTIVIRNAGDSKNRITATVDTDGNRTALTYDLT